MANFVADAVAAHPALTALLLVISLIAYGVAVNLELLPSNTLLRQLPSAGRGHWLTGHFVDCFSNDPDLFSFQCFHNLGPVHTIKGLFGKTRIVIQDPKALAHCIKNAYDYPKTHLIRGEIGRTVGHGVLWEEGENHKRQRKMLNPAFTAGNMRALAPVFTTLAHQLADRFEEVLANGAHERVNISSDVPYETKQGGIIIDAYHWFFRVALDAVGVGGFSRVYGSIHNEEQGIARAFAVWSSSEELDLSVSGIFKRIAQMTLPKWVPGVDNEQSRIIEDVGKVLDDDASDMLAERKQYLNSGGSSDDHKHDVLTILMKNNMKASGKDKLTDAEVFAQIKTFIFAGHETTSTALSWVFYLLGANKHIQDRLRAEIMAAKAEAENAGLDDIPPEVLETMPFLDAVLKEQLRLRGPVPGRSFEAQRDDVIPLSKPVTLANGKVVTEIPIKKGQELYSWHTVTNKRTDVWGEDAAEFNPQRWLDNPDLGRSGGLGGAALYGQMMSFFGGPRGCIGYKFAVSEMKAILAVLLERFEFQDLKGFTVSARTHIVMRPAMMRKDGEMDNQMPLRVARLGA